MGYRKCPRILRIRVQANSLNIPENLLVRIAKKGLSESLKTFIIQKHPRTFEELKDAAILAEKSHLFQAKQQLSVNAITQHNMKLYEDKMDIIINKLEDLGSGHQQLKSEVSVLKNEKFGNQSNSNKIHQNSGRNFTPKNHNFGKQNYSRQNFGQQPARGYQNSTHDRNNCSACGNQSCSGSSDMCRAHKWKCAKCEKYGHYPRFCRSIRNVRGEIIRQ